MDTKKSITFLLRIDLKVIRRWNAKRLEELTGFALTPNEKVKG